MDFLYVFGFVYRHAGEMGLNGGEEIRVEGRHEIVIVLLLVGALKYIPRQVVDVPGMREVYVREAE